MNRKSMGLSCLALVLCLALHSPLTHADEVSDLRNLVQDLRSELDMVKGQVRTMEGHISAGGTKAGIPPIVPAGEEVPSGLIHTLQDIHMGGYLDAQWSNNFHQYHTPSQNGSATVPLRIFDARDGSFVVNAAELNFEKAAEEAGQAGFRVDLQFGQDATVVLGDGNGGSGNGGDAVDLQQAYAEYIAPLSFFEGNSVLPSEIKLKAGRFVTLAGAEVIEGPDNWNISRSYMFGLAIPFTHTGIRSEFGLFDNKIDFYAGLNNGWDLALDNNGFKTVELGAGYNILDNLKAFHAFYWGPELNGAEQGKRWLITNVITLEATDKLTFMADVDYGSQHNAFDTDFVNPIQINAEWFGIAGYAKYQFTDKAALAYRAEFFGDDEAYRTGAVGAAAGVFASDRNFEQTVTAEYKLSDNLLARAEFRHDKSNDDKIYAGNRAQTSLGAQIVYVI